MHRALRSATVLLLGLHGGHARAQTWTQPTIRTGIDSVEALGWASTIEEALERARAEKKLVLATVVAVSSDYWVSGYSGAPAVRAHLKAPHAGEEVSSASDEGLRKERVLMASWFTDPDVAALVKKHFVPVRVRCRPWDFDVVMPGADPLAPLGTTLDVIGAPALLVAKADGTLVHSLGRIGVFAPSVGSMTLRAALTKAKVRDVASQPAEPHTSIPPDAVEFAARLGLRLEEWTRGGALALDPRAPTTEVDASKNRVDEILGRAADVLLLLQSESGAWRDPVFDMRQNSGTGTQYDREVARTALVVDALLALRSTLPARKKDLEAAARRGIAVVGKFADDPQPWIWQVTYALHLQVTLLRSDLDEEKLAARARAARLIQTLAPMQQGGGWSYAMAPRTHSFNTALVLLLLSEARMLGVTVPDELLASSIKFLASLRNPDDARDYWYAPAMKFEPRASTCRTSLCELALLVAGDESASRRIGPAVAYFLDAEPAARSVTKVYETFLSPVSLQDAYHYYFGHYYTARALAHMPRAKAANAARRQLAVIKRQVEADGSFVDAQAQGKSYSTAMAVLTILECQRWAKR
jgi:hypothetical protein